MLIDTEHLHFWMNAIRQSPNPMRTLDAFWAGQIKSKEWLIENLKPFVKDYVDIEIYGGWVGTLASLLFQSEIPINKILNIDIDPVCEPIAHMMNKQEEIAGRFKAVTSDMCNMFSSADVIINTSCEHLTQPQYDLWLSRMKGLLVLQGNNYDIPEHVRTSSNLQEFKQQCRMKFVLWEGEFETPLYTRYMIIGHYNV
jgi:hypothetical protein